MSAISNPRLGGDTNIPYILAQSGVPVILVPNGTVATNGTITVGTALPTTYSGGAWIRLPAGAIVSGSAGLYWCVFSSTTVGQVYTNFSDPATQFIPTVPGGTLTAAVGSNAAYTQTTAEVTLVNATLPSNSLGSYGGVRFGSLWDYPNNANSKTIKGRFGSFIYRDFTATTTVCIQFLDKVRNYGTTRQSAHAIGSGSFNSSASAVGRGSVDTGADQSLLFTGQIGVATDFLIIEGFSMEIFSS